MNSFDDWARRFRRAAGAPPLILGHRGASARAPENTLKAFALAMDEGADGVELDVRLCGSGEVVVAHDLDLRRVAQDPAQISALSLHELRRRDVGGGEHVPTLDEALALVLGRDGVVNVELKADGGSRLALARGVDQVLGTLGKTERARVILSTFDAPLLALFPLVLQHEPRAFLFDAEHTGPNRAAIVRRLASIEAVHPHHAMLTAENVARWHARGLLVNTWTVDDPQEARRLATIGVDAIITNDVRGIRGAIGK